jgi:hypothetical protein
MWIRAPHHAKSAPDFFMSTSPADHHVTRPLDPIAAAIVVGLCL